MGKEIFIVMRQVNALFEARVKTVMQGSYINLTCLRTTEMKKRKHLADDNKDVMTGNTTFKCQRNGQFCKPSGRQVLLKHDNLLNEFPHTLVTIFFPCSATVNSVLSFGTKIKGRECHPAAGCQSPE